MERKGLLFLGGLGVAIVLILGVVAVWILSSEQQPTPVSPTIEGSLWPEQPAVWSVDRESESVALVASDAGPQIYVSPKEKVSLSPVWEGLELTWAHTQEGKNITFTGEGQWNEKPAVATFVVAQGNPQATFSLEVQGLTRADLRAHTARPRLVLPVGDVHLLNNQMRVAPFVPSEEPTVVDGWTPGWMRWVGQGRTIQFSQWQADQTRVSEVEGGKLEVEFDFFDVDAQLHMDGCKDLDGLEAKAQLRYIVTVGQAPMLVLGRFPGGFRAIVAPIFDDPRNHPSAAYSKTGAKEDAKFSKRARTLLLGHSDTTDPRHGNGGLAPAHLGGTVAWNGVEGDALRALKTQLPVGSEVVGPDVRLEGECEVDAPKLLKPFAIGGTQPYNAGYRNAVSAGTTPRSDGVYYPVQLSGEKTQLLGQAMGDLYLQRLERERGLFVFSTPFVATRNPLVPAAKDTILQPERDGKWTLDPAFAKALAAMELNAETSALGFTSIGNLARYRTQSQGAMLAWTAQGEVKVVGAPDDSTVLVEGAFTPDTNTIRRADVEDRRQQPQTWMFVGAPEANITMGLQPDQQLTPIEWSISK